MTIIIKLSTGKEIELTEAEYQELKGSAPLSPTYPNPWTNPGVIPWYPNQPYYTITCSSSNLPPKE